MVRSSRESCSHLSGLMSFCHCNLVEWKLLPFGFANLQLHFVGPLWFTRIQFLPRNNLLLCHQGLDQSLMIRVRILGRKQVVLEMLPGHLWLHKGCKHKQVFSCSLTTNSLCSKLQVSRLGLDTEQKLCYLQKPKQLIIWYGESTTNDLLIFSDLRCSSLFWDCFPFSTVGSVRVNGPVTDSRYPAHQQIPQAYGYRQMPARLDSTNPSQAMGGYTLQSQKETLFEELPFWRVTRIQYFALLNSLVYTGKY